MRTSAKEWPVAEHLGRPRSNERNGEVRCVQLEKSEQGPPRAVLALIVAGEN
jgi:hypothetical protein